MKYEEICEFTKERDLTMERYERLDYDRFLNSHAISYSFPFIHIAGSNGKSSVAHYLENIYRSAGYHVGSFIKPLFGEDRLTIRIDGEPIAKEDFETLFARLERDFVASNLSRFEILAILAIMWFKESKVDIAIVECGMGGAIDATNIPNDKPLLSIITSVSLEHTDFLGRTLSEVAFHKAGIIKKGCPVLIGKLPDAPREVIETAARKLKADVYSIDDYHREAYSAPYYRFDYNPYHDLAIASPAAYEILDATIAVEAVKILRLIMPVSEASLKDGLLKAPLPARLERVKNVYLDGAHNPEAIQAMIKDFLRIKGERNYHVLFASFRDKNIAVELPLLAKEASSVTLTTFDSPRARTEMDYLLYSQDYPFVESYEFALNNLLATYPDDLILVTGSLEFAYRAREYLRDVLSNE